MRRVLIGSAVVLALSIPAAFSNDVTLGHVNLPKGKYVLTNTDTHSTLVVTIDEHGVVKGPKPAPTNVSGAATPPAVPAGTAPTAATPAAAAPPSAGTSPQSTSAVAPTGTTSKIISDKIKKEAQRAITRGDVQKLMKKVGLD